MRVINRLIGSTRKTGIAARSPPLPIPIFVVPHLDLHPIGQLSEQENGNNPVFRRTEARCPASGEWHAVYLMQRVAFAILSLSLFLSYYYAVSLLPALALSQQVFFILSLPS